MFSGTKQIARLKAVARRNSTLRDLAIDVLLEDYVSWREECVAVWSAYQRWADADRARRVPAYAEYAAALDREELAARIYAQQLSMVSRVYG